ncbi:hypothetical protein [Maridesulfovibrio sp.]|uniref:hypothetical protein n=1 Tax=Maridesulfovibrio sp. TaxID=2795000 RepID=UPI0039F0E0CD
MSLDGNMSVVQFKDINLNDIFFDSLKDAYNGFAEWFERKSDQYAYIMANRSGIQAFLYLKVEHGPVVDISPPLNTAVCLKVGTFKINAHGTKLGERFIKKVFDHAIVNNISHIYVTVFHEHEPLIGLLERYGFCKYGKKISRSGEEVVLVKDFNQQSDSPIWNYPVVNRIRTNCWLMSIYPQWHTRLFPDSILRTESSNIIQDISHTNSIHKVYIGWMNGMEHIKKGDSLLIYRAVGKAGRPWFESVISSLCVALENRGVGEFSSLADFKSYVAPYSVFSEGELENIYNTRKRGRVIAMSYNIALPKRLNMKTLVEKVGLNREDYWGFRPISSDEFEIIFQLSRMPSCAIIK